MYWNADKTTVGKDVFLERLRNVLSYPEWIIDGNFGRTLPLRLEYCDTVIFLDFSRWACVCGVLKRVLSNWGKVRPDMGAGCPERFDWAFLKFVWNFNKTGRKKLYSRFSSADPSVKIVILRNRRQVKRFLKTL